MTPLFKRLGFLLVLAGIWMAPAMADAPHVVQTCGSAGTLGATYNGTWYCNLNNTTSGNTIIVTVAGDTTTVVPTATESLTCPAGAVQVVSIYRIYTCYVATASGHSAFNISVAASGGTGQGIFMLTAEEIQGLGAIDSSASSGSATTPGSITTSANNEWVHMGCWINGTALQAGSPFTQINEAQNSAGTNIWNVTAQTVVGTAGAQSVPCTNTSSFFGGITMVAFAESSPVTPTVHIVQQCTASDADPSTACNLYNVSNGNKILYVGSLQYGVPPVVGTTCTTNGGGVTCQCPSSSQATGTYALPQGSTNITTAACYYDLTSNYTTFTVGQTCSSCTSHSFVAMEVAGLATGVDAPSEAAAAATTVNYTTAQANEWTLCGTADFGASPANAMVIGNSFLPAGATFYPNNSRGAGQLSQITALKKTVSSGSNTCSYTQTGSTNPQIVTFSILPLPSTARSHGAIL